MDFNLYQYGREFRAFNFFGAHYDGKGTQFRTHAPNARQVFLIGDFNNWQNQAMDVINGVWELYVEGSKPGDCYKYRIEGPHGGAVDHADPYAFASELRPNTASVIHQTDNYEFNDAEWMANRSNNLKDRPVSVYEVHLGSWRTKVHELGDYTEDGVQINHAHDNWYTYREIAKPLADYCVKSGFTHIELLPLAEHPLDMSWGYLPLGYFSPTSRYGSPDDFKYFVDVMHEHNLGVIMDFVPVHFPSNDYGLANYDGTAFYEYPFNDLRYSEWGSLNFNLMKGEVRSFLNSAATFWLEEYHIDGLRIDAVSNLLYYQGRKDKGVNDAAIDFIKQFNEILEKEHPDVMRIAEDSSDYPGVTNDVKHGGLGFHYKWDMGWMNDTLDFFAIPSWERRNHYNQISFSMMYFYSEKFMLPLSHDEVVHGDKSIVDKMYGNYDEKFPQARSLYLYMYAHPGKKLNFMGNEFAQFREWDEKREQDWTLLEYHYHKTFYKFFTDINRLYRDEEILYMEEFHDKNYHWTIVDDWMGVVYAFTRGDGDEKLWFIFNFSGETHDFYAFDLYGYDIVEEVINTDWVDYGGGTERPSAGVNSWQNLEEGRFAISLRGYNSRAFRIRKKK